jgi:hypothetical protein
VTAPLETTVYLSLVPTHSRYGERKVNGFSVAGITKTPPKTAKGPVIKLKLKLPAAAFEPLRPTVEILIPEEHLDYTPVVTVEPIEVIT